MPPLLRLVALLLLALRPAVAASSPPRVVIETSEGALTVELYPEAAPQAVARFLARAGLTAAPDGVVTVFPYAGSQVCELRAQAFVAFGCAATGVPTPDQPRPRAPGIEPPVPDEIDAAALGLEERTISEPKERDWLIQQEVFPRALRLRETGRPLPPGLAALTAAIETRGMGETDRLLGRSRLWYLETLGYSFRRGGSALRTARGVLLHANLWPGEADERFLVAFAALPDRDGRATAFGRVVDGLDTLDRIERLSVDRYRRPRTPVLVHAIRPVEGVTTR